MKILLMMFSFTSLLSLSAFANEKRDQLLGGCADAKSAYENSFEAASVVYLNSESLEHIVRAEGFDPDSDENKEVMEKFHLYRGLHDVMYVAVDARGYIQASCDTLDRLLTMSQDPSTTSENSKVIVSLINTTVESIEDLVNRKASDVKTYSTEAYAKELKKISETETSLEDRINQALEQIKSVSETNAQK
jgi:hypothetical protein